MPFEVSGEPELANLAVGLGATEVGGPLSPAEALLAAAAQPLLQQRLLGNATDDLRQAILAGGDPLGTLFMALRSPEVRRGTGQIFTPPSLADPISRWIERQAPNRVVDAGSGSGRFAMQVARVAPATQLFAVDNDPLATLLTRANLSVLGARSARVLHTDFLTVDIPDISGTTAYISNPPYLRHHQIPPALKAWGQMTARRVGISLSGLAGLHAYFFLAVADKARSGDVGWFLTSSEWLDVNYGEAIRQLLLGRLGGQSIDVLRPTAVPFENTMTTAAVTRFAVGTQPATIAVREVDHAEEIGDGAQGREVRVERLASEKRWLPVIRANVQKPAGYIELGELCRVHRGAVTGANNVWVVDRGAAGLPDALTPPAVTRATDLFRAGDRLTDAATLRSVIDLPGDLDELDPEVRRAVEKFLSEARAIGAADGYVARNRRAWWAVGLRNPAPILATYMARRAPAFVRNAVDARHINIAHGIYPRIPLDDRTLDRLAEALRASVTVAQGRTYAGGLTKFEPREMERLPVPDLPTLMSACPL